MLSIQSLTLHRFRNHRFTEIHPLQGSVILTGPNGAGKTNILEAISLLSPGRGLRKARLREMCSQQSDTPWVVSADIDGLQGNAHIGTSLDPQSERERRLIKIDGEKERSQTALAEYLAISWQTPQMDGLFLASDGERRRYLDRLIYGFDAAHLTRVNQYEHAMRERNRVLAQGPADANWLHALEQQMASNGVAIASARLEVLARLNASMQTAQDHFPRAMLSMAGELEGWLQEDDASAAEEKAATAFEQYRPRDAAAGRALFGAHKSIWQVMHQEKQMHAAYCSTGEQKALLLSILLAHARARKDWLGLAPVLLLDETVAHLDETRRAALAEALVSLKTQAWLTGTDAADFAAFEDFATLWRVVDGMLEEQP